MIDDTLTRYDESELEFVRATETPTIEPRTRTDGSPL